MKEIPLSNDSDGIDYSECRESSIQPKDVYELYGVV
jgi:hypothetical protein